MGKKGDGREKESIAFLQKMLSYDLTIIDEGADGNEGEAQGDRR